MPARRTARPIQRAPQNYDGATAPPSAAKAYNCRVPTAKRRIGHTTGYLRDVLSAIAIVAVGSAHTGIFAQQARPFLRDHECPVERTLVADVEQMRIFAACSTVGDARLVNFTVVNPSERLLGDFSIGFCRNPVIAAESPHGWKSETTDGRVRWTAIDEVANRNGQSGFSVTLNPGWRLSGMVSVGWHEAVSSGGGSIGTGGGFVSAVTHSCD